MGNWPQHVPAGWPARRSRTRGGPLRAAAVIAGGGTGARAALIGQPVDQARLRAAIDACGFDSLR